MLVRVSVLPLEAWTGEARRRDPRHGLAVLDGSTTSERNRAEGVSHHPDTPPLQAAHGRGGALNST